MKVIVESRWPDVRNYEPGTILYLLKSEGTAVRAVYEAGFRWIPKGDVKLEEGCRYEVDEWDENIRPVSEGQTLLSEDGMLHESHYMWVEKVWYKRSGERVTVS